MPWDLVGLIETVNEMTKSPMGQLLLGGGAVSVVVSSGLVPRVGLGRAAGLALRSKLFPLRPHTLSRRSADVSALTAAVEHLERGNYIVVTGPMGVGKSTVVETALWRTCGVVRTTVQGDTHEDAIVSTALAEIARTRQHSYLDPRLNAGRVRFFYDLLPLKSPIIVLNVRERRSDVGYAGVTGATRELSELGYRVVVDGSTNALPDRLLRTNREKVLTMGPMTMDVMETVPEFRLVFDVLRELNRIELVWAVCGGNPALMVTLHQELRGARDTPEGRLTPESKRELADIVDAFCLERTRQAVGRVTELEAKHPELKELLEMFKTEDIVFDDVVREKAIVRPDDDKVLRAADTTGALIPADAATAVVLRHGLVKPTIEKLHHVVGQVAAKE
mmetsp:Transcript_8752/g.26369  ORF Transcript_8752/g.26369 Transcript_8752/m.26369 type:complete len:391 (+) Transcript_8752:592-1764(+)